MGFKWSHEILDAVCDGKRPPYSKENHQEAPAGFVELMTTCWAQSPDKRPQFNWVIRGLQDVQSAWHARQRQRMTVIGTTKRLMRKFQWRASNLCRIMAPKILFQGGRHPDQRSRKRRNQDRRRSRRNLPVSQKCSDSSV